MILNPPTPPPGYIVINGLDYSFFPCFKYIAFLYLPNFQMYLAVLIIPNCWKIKFMKILENMVNDLVMFQTNHWFVFWIVCKNDSLAKDMVLAVDCPVRMEDAYFICHLIWNVFLCSDWQSRAHVQSYFLRWCKCAGWTTPKIDLHSALFWTTSINSWVKVRINFFFQRLKYSFRTKLIPWLLMPWLGV